MNRRVLHAAVACCLFHLMQSAWGNEPFRINLKPGDTWVVEVLDEGERQQGGRATRPESGSKAVVVVEENVMGSNFRQQTLLDGDGRLQFKRWLRGNRVFYPEADLQRFQFETIHAEMRGGAALPDRLLEFSWLNSQWKKGSSLIDGEECWIFETPAEASSTDSTSPTGHWAAVRVKDGRPLRLETPYEVRRYRWSHQPPPDFPEAAERAVREFEKALHLQMQRHNVAR